MARRRGPSEDSGKRDGVWGAGLVLIVLFGAVLLLGDGGNAPSAWRVAENDGPAPVGIETSPEAPETAASSAAETDAEPAPETAIAASEPPADPASPDAAANHAESAAPSAPATQAASEPLPEDGFSPVAQARVRHESSTRDAAPAPLAEALGAASDDDAIRAQPAPAEAEHATDIAADLAEDITSGAVAVASDGETAARTPRTPGPSSSPETVAAEADAAATRDIEAGDVEAGDIEPAAAASATVAGARAAAALSASIEPAAGPVAAPGDPGPQPPAEPDDIALASLSPAGADLAARAEIGDYAPVAAALGIDPPRMVVAALPGDPTPPPPRRPETAPDAPAIATPPTEALLAIVIDDLGPAVRASRRTIALPGPLTMAFLPHAKQSPRMADEARRAGHEVALHLPMEPIGGENPGPGALLKRHGPEEIAARVEAAFEALPDVSAVNNHMGSLLTQDGAAMSVVMRHLRERGAPFLDSRTTASSRAIASAQSAGVPAVGRDIFLDAIDDRDFVEKQLAQAIRLAKREGVAIAIGHPYATTLDVLERELPGVERREGVRLVGVSRVIALRGCLSPAPVYRAFCGRPSLTASN